MKQIEGIKTLNIFEIMGIKGQTEIALENLKFKLEAK